MTAIIFVGPSLPPGLRPSEEIWDWRPPVRQGELYRAALARPEVIGVIDGYFEVVPAVWHKEILWAMAEGIRVYGAASIGALRAAELDRFGMRGVGQVYEDFRDGILEDDDEVAVLHGPMELGYPSVTEAMVNIRATLTAAVEAGVLTPHLAAVLTDTGKALFYKDRTFETLLRRAATTKLADGLLRDFARWLPTGRIDRKRRDAEAMLAAIRTDLATGLGPLQVDYPLAETIAWRAAYQSAV